MRKYILAGASLVILLGLSALLVIRYKSADSQHAVSDNSEALTVAVDLTDNSLTNPNPAKPELAGALRQETVPADIDSDNVKVPRSNPANAITRLGELLVGGNSACNPRVVVCE